MRGTSFWRSRWGILLIVVLVLVVVAGLAAAWAWKKHQTHNVHGSAKTEFVSTATPGHKRPRVIASELPWPTYGLDEQRSRLVFGTKVRPPYRTLWVYKAKSLLEFPPAIAYHYAYLPIERGIIRALEAWDGRVVWSRRFNACIAASPAVAKGVVYESLLNPCDQPHDNKKGAVVALNAQTGKTVWRAEIGATESSPLVVNGVVYVGSRNNRVYALDAKTGRVRWTYTTGGEVKGAGAYIAGTVYFGSYDGHVYALNARNGKLRWRASAESRLGGRGTFYANPAIAYGRVYIGATDGVVYSFGATSGRLLWARRTGGYVYSSAALWRRTVYVGSYDHHLYAIDAATGDVRWAFHANGAISGSPTVLNGVVYFSTLKARTYGLDALSGKVVWTFTDGYYSPIVADQRRAYLVGYARLFALRPR
ncbi:MAG TPA: PQQ-binding-like beta-propeller repeat protein [Gaiellaceae bacterium]|nr:PQQ-binding-like beta-propeller repeat protein [Gaiellaceae bacterium]